MIYKDKAPRVHDVDPVVATGRIYFVKQQPCFRIQQVSLNQRKREERTYCWTCVQWKKATHKCGYQKGSQRKEETAIKSRWFQDKGNVKQDPEKYMGQNNNIKGSGKIYYSVEIQ